MKIFIYHYLPNTIKGFGCDTGQYVIRGLLLDCRQSHLINCRIYNENVIQLHICDIFYMYITLLYVCRSSHIFRHRGPANAIGNIMYYSNLKVASYEMVLEFSERMDVLFSSGWWQKSQIFIILALCGVMRRWLMHSLTKGKQCGKFPCHDIGMFVLFAMFWSDQIRFLPIAVRVISLALC